MLSGDIRLHNNDQVKHSTAPQWNEEVFYMYATSSSLYFKADCINEKIRVTHARHGPADFMELDSFNRIHFPLCDVVPQHVKDIA